MKYLYIIISKFLNITIEFKSKLINFAESIGKLRGHLVDCIRKLMHALV